MERSYETPGPVELYVELGAGDVTVRATGTATSTVEVLGPRAGEFTVEQRGTHLVVVPPRGRFFGSIEPHTVRIEVPDGSGLTGKLGSADLHAAGAYGIVRLKTGSGDVEVDESASAVVIESGSGDIRGHRLGGDVRIKSGSGDVAVDSLGATTGISTGSGDVQLGEVGRRTVVKTGSGDLRVRRSRSALSLTTASGDVVVGAAPAGTLTIRNVSGDVRLGVPAGTPVWTDISSVSGRVASNLASAGKPSEGQAYLEVRATTVSGDVVLEQADDHDEE